MARKRISVLLGLKDKFTSPLKKTSDETKKFQREINKAKKVVNNFGTSVNDKFKSIAKTAAKTLGAASIGAITAGTVKGFSEAFDLETYKAQLETATGSTEKAAELMKDQDKKLETISFLVGYDDYNYFSRVFRKKMGSSPREYRNNLV